MDEKSISFFRFEDLRIYGKAVEYGRWLVSTLKDGGNDAEKNLNRSFVASSLDIAINIAEGSSRNKSQFDHYLKIAKTAIRECIVYTTVCQKVGMFSDEAAETSRELLMEQTRMIGALIISLQRGTRRGHDDADAPSVLDDMPVFAADDTLSDSFKDFEG